MNLLFDVGNTRTKIAFFNEKGIIGKVRQIEKPTIKDVKRIVGKRSIEKVGISQVGKMAGSLKNHLKRNFQLLELDEKTKIPITNRYKTPKTLGRDRLAAVIGAHAIFPKSPCLVIDAGTCVKYDLITKSGSYIGGGISPGMYLRFKAMNDHTANLPLVPFSKSAKYLGRNTKECLQAGAQWGFILEIEGFIRSYKKEFAGLKVLLTGGDAEYLAKNMKTKIFVNPNLVLEGLNKILEQ